MVQVLFQTVLTSLKGLIVSPKPVGIRESTKYETCFQLAKEAPLIFFRIIKKYFLFLNLSQTVWIFFEIQLLQNIKTSPDLLKDQFKTRDVILEYLQ